MSKDWIGNRMSIYAPHGASNHSDWDREKDDYYATEPEAIDWLLSVEDLQGIIWECACGEGHLSKRLEELGKTVMSTDLIDRGYGTGGVDFLKVTEKDFDANIVTNPPYKYALEFCEKALDVVREGGVICMFLKLTFLEGRKRRKFFDLNPPKTVYVFSKRMNCARNGDFSVKQSAVCYAWFVWVKGWKGETVVKWIG